MTAANATFGSLYVDAQQPPPLEVAACAAASGFMFQRGELPTASQLRRMCRQSDCIVTVNAINGEFVYYDTVVERLRPLMEAVVYPVLDFCYHYHTPNAPCPQDFVGQLFSDLDELTTACETKSGFSIRTNRPPMVTYAPNLVAPGSGSGLSFGSIEAPLRPLCGVAECDNLMKRLDMKQDTATCPLAVNEQKLLVDFVGAYKEQCDVIGTPTWILTANGFGRTQQVRAVYVALPGPLPPLTPLPATLPAISSGVPPTATRPTVEPVATAATASTRPLTELPTTKKPQTSTSTVHSKTIDTDSGSHVHDESQGSGSSGSTGSRDRSSGSDRSDALAVPVPVDGATRSLPSPTESLAPTTNANSLQDPNNAVSWGALSAGLALLLLVCGFVWWRRHRQRQLTAADSDAYQSLATSSGFVVSTSSSLQAVPIACRVIPTAHLTDVRIVGGGASGVVYLVRYSGSDSAHYNGVLASKRCSNQTKDQVDVLVAEINLASSLSHPRIVTFVGIAGRHKTELQALFEYLPGGDLKRYLDSQPLPSVDPAHHTWTPVKLQIAIDVADALVYLHTLEPTPVVHRDLKSRNIMLTSDTRAKLGDFGISRIESTAGSMTTGVGTSRWVAPEVILGGGDYTTACDVYSFGVVLTELDTHRLPFAELTHANGEQLADFVVLEMVATQRKQPSLSASCPTSLVALTQRCLAFEPEHRPKAADVGDALRNVQRGMGWNPVV